MSEELAPGWASARLGDLVEPIEVTDPTRTPDAVFRYIDIGSIDNEALRISEPKTFSGKEAPSRARRVVREGDVLFSTVRPYLRNIALAGVAHSGCLTSTGISVLRAKPSVLPGYLFRLVSSHAFVEEVGRSMDGTLYPAVRDSDVFAASIPLPPLAEQRRIVARIEALFARTRTARAHLLRIAPLAQRYREAATERAYEADPAAGWRTTTAGELSEIKSGITLGKRYPANAALVERPYLRVANVQRGHLNLEQIKTILLPATDAARLALQHGDILMNEGGDRDKLGRGWVWQGEIPHCIHQNHVFRLRLRGNAVTPHYLSRYANHFGARYFLDEGKQTTNLASISMAKVAALPVPVPPAGHAARIDELLDSAEAVSRAIEHEATRALVLLDHLERSILARAFRGELVPQNPADEPAAVTLTRAAATPAAPRRGRPRRAA